ncbi:hypothetical protein [Methylobacterium bullatum]|uniref:hypothetical protein n=1 Tax=Methylobacterium bullatum TaxID=570505 RepID=UPI0030D090C1
MIIEPNHHVEIVRRVEALPPGALFSLTEIDKALDLPQGKSRSHVGVDGKFFPCSERGGRGKKKYPLKVVKRYAVLLALTGGINGVSFKFPDAKDKILSLELNDLWASYSKNASELLRLCVSTNLEDRKPTTQQAPPLYENSVISLPRAVKRGAS